MRKQAREHKRSDGDRDLALADAFGDILEQAPEAFAITEGPGHSLRSMNAAFRSLAGDAEGEVLGRPIADVLDMAGLRSLLDVTFTQAHALRNDLWLSTNGGSELWACSTWPLPMDGDATGLVVELRPASARNRFILAKQREVAERLLLGALRQKELADAAEASREHTSFLEDAGRKLAGSIDEVETHRAITEMHLPQHSHWCIVDLVDDAGEPLRLGIIHPDPVKQAYARSLGDWQPQPGDPFGVTAVQNADDIVTIVDGVDDALARGSHDPQRLAGLRTLGMGTLLTVPMVNHGRVAGAITFVGTKPGQAYTEADIRLARDLALRSAMALDSARLYREAVDLRAKAEAADRTKSDFLGHMSHELRTPLNAIGGYVDIMDLEIHGPMTALQHADLERIRVNQQHLLRLINDILHIIQLQAGSSRYSMTEVVVTEALATGVSLVEPLMLQKQITHRIDACDPGLRVHADRDRLAQILVNLLTNAIKFTEPGGSITITCEATDDAVSMAVKDTGIGITSDWIDSVFEPFVQVKSGLTDREGGVGLGLAISRDLARGMDGDVTVRSTAGEGSEFTVTLTRVR